MYPETRICGTPAKRERVYVQEEPQLPVTHALASRHRTSIFLRGRGGEGPMRGKMGQSRFTGRDLQLEAPEHPQSPMLTVVCCCLRKR